MSSSASLRLVTLSLLKLSCPNCLPPLRESLTELISSYDSSLPLPQFDFPNRMVTLTVPATISDEDLINAVVSAGTGKSATVLSSEPLPNVSNNTGTTLRRYRCGCNNQFCRCSPVPVVSGDKGVLVSLLVDEKNVNTCCKGCKCISTDICKCKLPEMSTSAGSRSPETEIQLFDTSQRILSISGMTCGSCVASVRHLLNSVHGVQSSSISLVTTRAVLEVIDEQFILSNVLEKLSEAGYTGQEIKSSPQNECEVFLRFSSMSIAEKACETLRQQKDVIDVKIWTPSDEQDDISTSLKRAQKSSRSYVKIDDKLSTHCFSAKSESNDVLPVVCLRSSSKLSSVELLHENSIQFSVIPRTDPMLTGVKTTSEILRQESKEYYYAFLGALIFTLPLAIITMGFAKISALGSEFLHQYLASTGFRIVDVVAFVLTTPVQFVFGFRFYRGSWYGIKQRRANMDLLIALGTTIAYLFSVIVPILNTVQIKRGEDVSKEVMAFETSALLITIVLLGKWMQSIAKQKTALGIESLAKLAPRTVTLVSPPPQAKELFNHPVDPELVSVGDYFRVNPGSSFPLDGIIQHGYTTVDESMLTGESWPVKKSKSDQVYAGTVNQGNAVVVRCSAGGRDSMLEKIMELVKHAQNSRAPVEEFADRVSVVFVPLVLIIALVVTIMWFILAKTGTIPESWTAGEGDVLFSVLFGLSVLVIACPCALGLATPTVIMMATSIAAKKFGILYKDGGEALQAAYNVKTVLFDKTGTLTIGKPVVTCVSLLHINPEKAVVDVEHKAESLMQPNLLNIIGAAESYSDHPLAHAISGYVKNQSTKCDDAVNIVNNETLTGRGLRCKSEDGRIISVGKQEWIMEEIYVYTGQKLSLSTACREKVTKWEHSGKTVVWAYVSDGQAVVFGIEDPVRTESRSVIDILQKRGVKCRMVTGDSRGTALNVARLVGIDEEDVYARALPTEKVDIVRENLANCTKKSEVVFVGDGINDAAALSVASVGIAMASGTQVAAESAAIVLVKSNLCDVVTALDLAHVAFHRIKLNYVWALGFNCLAIPLAAGAAFPFLHTRIPPYAAAVAMGLSSIAVVLCSLSLRFYQAPKLDK